MRHIIVTFFCSFLSPGNLQAVENDNSYRLQQQPDLVPAVEEHIWPVQTYQTFRGNFYGTARRSINPKPCVRHSGTQDLNSQEISFEQFTNNQLAPTPTRRSSVLESFEHPSRNMKSINFQPQILKDTDSSTLRIQTQVLRDENPSVVSIQPSILKEEGPSTLKIKTEIIQNERPSGLRTQPQVLKDEESNLLKTQAEVLNDDRLNAYKIKTQIIKDEESNAIEPRELKSDEINTLTIKTQIIKDEEPNIIKIHPQDLKDEETKTVRIKTKIIENEETNTLRIKPKILKDEGPDTFKIETKVLQEKGSNNLRTNPKISKIEKSNTFRVKSQVVNDDELNTFRKQPSEFSEEESDKFKLHTQVLRSDESNSLGPSSEVSENLLNSAFSKKEKKPFDDSLVNLKNSTQDVEIEEEGLAAPGFEIERVETFSFEGSADHIVSPSAAASSEPLRTQSNNQCSNKRRDAAAIPQSQRRFLKDGNNNEISTFDRSNVIRPNDNSKGNIYEFTNKVLRTNTDNQENGPYSQDDDIPALSAKARMGKDEKIKESELFPREKSLEKSLQRAGKIQFVLGPQTNPVKDPTQGQGISYIKKTTLMLMDYERVCYACSTANNPACSQPDRRTGVKYCRKGDNGCVTKTFQSGGSLTLIRDCGRSCEDTEAPGLKPNYKSCGICYSDLCNSAYSINVHSLILTLPSLAIIVLVKSLL